MTQRLQRLCLGVAVTGLIVFAGASLRWPMFHDAPLIEYGAWLIGRGRRPYADLFEMNFPGTYLFHVVGQQVFGVGDLSFRVRDLLVLAAALVAVRRVLVPFGSPATTLGPLLVGASYLRAGVFDSMQRDWLIAVAAMIAAALLLDSGSGRRGRCAVAGLAIGFAVTVKPQALMLIAVAPLLLALGDAGRLDEAGPIRFGRAVFRDVASRTAAVLGGAATSIGAVAIWLSRQGGWGALRHIVSDYLPLYALLDGGGREYGSTLEAYVQTVIRTVHPTRSGMLVLPVATAVVVLMRARGRTERARVLGLVVLALAGYLHAVSAVKVWSYHFWPMLLPLFVLLAVAYADAWNGTPPTVPVRRRRPAAGIGAAVVIVGVIRLGAAAMTDLADLVGVIVFVPVLYTAALDVRRAFRRDGTEPGDGTNERAPTPLRVAAVALPLAFLGIAGAWLGFTPDYVDPPRMSQVRDVADYLSSHVGRRDRALVLDTTSGAVNAMLRSRTESATTYIYDFHFFHHDDDPVIVRMRADLMRQLREQPPRFIVRSDSSWSDRFELAAFTSFPELDRFLRDYRPRFTSGELTVLERR